ncbi:hypothetical protein [Croceiramulus getboli]|nr:hypothetical protein P8624_02845 [Flavobacteriaceae bacterium YJPT1-3]
MKNVMKSLAALTLVGTLQAAATEATTTQPDTDKIVKAEPSLREKNDRVYLNYLNLKKEKVVIKIYDNNNELVYSETINDEVIIGKVFDFSEVAKKDFRITIKTGKETYTKRATKLDS